MKRLYRSIALSPHPAARSLRSAYRSVRDLSIPAPRIVFRPLLYAFLGVRSAYYFLVRVFFCEPLFKAACTHVGKRVHTGVFLPWVQGSGELVLADDVLIDGKCSFFFAAQYSDRPTLTIGERTGIGHNCAFVVGKQITIGRDCRIASSVQMFDSPGHPLDPEKRRAGLPADAEDVRPITIGNNVWIGSSTIIFPGVTVGDNSVISMGSVVLTDVPANAVVAGNPARQIKRL